MQSLGALLPFVLIAAVFWLLLIRPQRQRQRAQQEMQSHLEPGTRVMTAGGLFGTVTEIDGDQVELEIADGVRVRFLAAAIAQRVPEPSEPGTDDAAIGVDGVDGADGAQRGLAG